MWEFRGTFLPGERTLAEIKSLLRCELVYAARGIVVHDRATVLPVRLQEQLIQWLHSQTSTQSSLPSIELVDENADLPPSTSRQLFVKLVYVPSKCTVLLTV